MTLRDLLEKNAAEKAEVIALKWCEDKVWKTRTWREYLARVRDLAEGYGTILKLRPRAENAAIILGNSPMWTECYLAQAGAGVSVVPMDPKLRDDETQYILADSEAVVVTTDCAHLKMMVTIARKLPKLRAIVVVDGPIKAGQKLGKADVYGFDDLRISGGGAWYDANRAAEDDIASIIYTSGTTGKPKGAMLTHRNFHSDIVGALDVFTRGTPQGHNFINETDSLFVVLPLFHAFSFSTNLCLSLWVGCPMYFCESLRTVGRDVKLLKPTIFMSVPLLCEKLYDKIDEGLKASKLARFLLKIGIRGPVMHMVAQKLGGKLRVMITGGAPCPKHVIDLFRRMHVAFFEGYGLTEGAPVVSVTTYTSRKGGPIGKPCGGIEIRLADKNEAGVGELQVKGPNVMKGYFHNDKATRETFDGDWLMTGDLASIDEDGDIYIRGRKKALIVNREGKNIYPEEVENAIAKEPLVQDVIVVGYTKGKVPGEYVGAIVYPDEEAVKAELGKMPEACELEKLLQKRVQEKTAELADYKRVRKVVVAKAPLERTSVGKVRRVTYKGTLDE